MCIDFDKKHKQTNTQTHTNTKRAKCMEAKNETITVQELFLKIKCEKLDAEKSNQEMCFHVDVVDDDCTTHCV